MDVRFIYVIIYYFKDIIYFTSFNPNNKKILETINILYSFYNNQMYNFTWKNNDLPIIIQN